LKRREYRDYLHDILDAIDDVFQKGRFFRGIAYQQTHFFVILTKGTIELLHC
jgi:hypothetical protein